MRPFVLLLLISTCINATQAVTVSKQVETSICANADLELALTPTVAYNTAFQWSKHADLHKWQFNSKVVNATAIPCVQYSYDTHIKLPSVFASYIGALMREIHIDKDVCYVDSMYVEKVRVRDVAIISGLEIMSHSTTCHETPDQVEPVDCRDFSATAAWLTSTHPGTGDSQHSIEQN